MDVVIIIWNQQKNEETNRYTRVRTKLILTSKVTFLGTGDVSMAVNDKCGIKKAGTRKLKRGGNKKKNKNKNKKNKKNKSTDSDEDIKIVGGNEAMVIISLQISLWDLLL